MAWIIRKLRIPAEESHTSIALAVCVFFMSLMAVGLIWQAQIISDQRESIHFLENLKLGS